jgi:hypothetical protein
MLSGPISRHHPCDGRLSSKVKKLRGVKSWERWGLQPLHSTLKEMTFTIHASKDGETIETHRASPVIAVAQARMLDMAGWQVQITDLAYRQYQLEKLDQLLSFDPTPAIKF